MSEKLKSNYLMKEKSFQSEIKNIFPCFESVLLTKQASKNVANKNFNLLNAEVAII